MTHCVYKYHLYSVNQNTILWAFLNFKRRLTHLHPRLMLGCLEGPVQVWHQAAGGPTHLRAHHPQGSAVHAVRFLGLHKHQVL